MQPNELAALKAEMKKRILLFVLLLLSVVILVACIGNPVNHWNFNTPAEATAIEATAAKGGEQFQFQLELNALLTSVAKDGIK